MEWIQGLIGFSVEMGRLVLETGFFLFVLVPLAGFVIVAGAAIVLKGGPALVLWLTGPWRRALKELFGRGSAEPKAADFEDEWDSPRRTRMNKHDATEELADDQESALADPRAEQ